MVTLKWRHKTQDAPITGKAIKFDMMTPVIELWSSVTSTLSYLFLTLSRRDNLILSVLTRGILSQG